MPIAENPACRADMAALARPGSLVQAEAAAALRESPITDRAVTRLRQVWRERASLRERGLYTPPPPADDPPAAVAAPPAPPIDKLPRGQCLVCHKTVAARRNGTAREHNAAGTQVVCTGAGQPVIPAGGGSQ
jgi:hypothetical protein